MSHIISLNSEHFHRILLYVAQWITGTSINKRVN